MDVQFVEFYRSGPTFLVGRGGDHLLDGCEVGLRVEESGDHDNFRQVERIIFEKVELLDSLQKIDDPAFQSSPAGVGEVGPDQRNFVEHECVHGLFHFL